MTQRTHTEERELRDPTLTALLQEAFRDDPALEPAPGRTERIMRTVLAAERRKPAAPFWSSLFWGAGATATAGLLLALMLGLGGMWKPDSRDVVKVDDPQKPVQQKQVAPPVKVEDVASLVNGASGKTPSQSARSTPQDPELTFTEREHRQVVPQPQQTVEETPTSVIPPAPSQEEVIVATALYKAGDTAYHTGDYEAAYQAFQDSYDAVPTPEAALSTSKVLLDMARQELDSETIGDV